MEEYIDIFVDSLLLAYMYIIDLLWKESNIFFRIAKEFRYQILEKGTKVINSSMHVTCAKVEKKRIFVLNKDLWLIWHVNVEAQIK